MFIWSFDYEKLSLQPEPHIIFSAAQRTFKFLMRSSEPQSRVNSIRQWIAFSIVAVLITGFACSLRILSCISDPLWLDELHTSWVVKDSISVVFQRASIGNQTPLYFWLTWISSQVFGFHELGLRLVSVASDFATMIIAATFVYWKTWSIQGAVLAVLVIGFTDPFFYYGAEARPYAMLQLLGLIQLIAFWNLLQSVAPLDKKQTCRRRNARTMASFIFVSLLMIYTHLTAIFVLIPELIFGICWMFVRWRKFRQESERPSDVSLAAVASLITIVVVALAVFCLPLLSTMQSVSDRSSFWSAVSSIPGLFRQLKWNWCIWFALPLVVAGVSQLPGFAGKSRQSKPGFQSLFTLVFSWGVGTTFVILFVHWAGIAPLALPRYLSVALAAGPILLGLTVGAFQRERNRWLVVIVVGCLVFASCVFQQQWVWRSLSSNRFLPQRMNSWSEVSWNQVVWEINRDQERTRYPIFLFGGILEDADALNSTDVSFQEYLRFPLVGLYQLEHQGVVRSGPTIHQPHFSTSMIDQALDEGGAWILVRHMKDIVYEIESEFIAKVGQPARIDRFQSDTGYLVLIRVDLQGSKL